MKKSKEKNIIRILHVIGIMNRGGAETMIMNLYRNMDRAKIQFDFVENTDQIGIFEKEIIELGGNIFHCPHFNGKNILEYCKWWDKFFIKHINEYSFVHGHIGSTAAIYLFMAKKYGIKTIAHSHNIYERYNFKQIAYKTLSYPTRFIADYLFACSREAGISRFGKNHKIYIINNAIDTQKFDFKEEERLRIRTEMKIEDQTIVYGNVGRFERQKNHVFLLHIFKEILKKQNNSILILIGNGSMRKNIEIMAKEMGINKNVWFLGIREDVASLLQCFDVMIFPSLNEGFGIAALEAQACGVNTLCSDRVSEACFITDRIHSLSLDLSPEEWANKAIELSRYERKSYQKEIIEAGFDIQKNAEWIQKFYLKEAGADE